MKAIIETQKKANTKGEMISYCVKSLEIQSETLLLVTTLGPESRDAVFDCWDVLRRDVDFDEEMRIDYEFERNNENEIITIKGDILSAVKALYSNGFISKKTFDEISRSLDEIKNQTLVSTNRIG